MLVGTRLTSAWHAVVVVLYTWYITILIITQLPRRAFSGVPRPQVRGTQDDIERNYRSQQLSELRQVLRRHGLRAEGQAQRGPDHKRHKDGERTKEHEREKERLEGGRRMLVSLAQRKLTSTASGRPTYRRR